jgi:hypothetical protein
MIRRLALVALFAALAAGTVLAHPGHDHKIMGTIASIDGTKMVVTTTEGKEVTVQVTEKTRLRKGKLRGAPADLKAGVRVVVNVGNGSEPLTAKEVAYSVTPTTAGSQ